MLLAFILIGLAGMVAETYLGWGSSIRAWAKKQSNK